MNWYLSVYNNRWCQSVSTQVHEIGTFNSVSVFAALLCSAVPPSFSVDQLFCRVLIHFILRHFLFNQYKYIYIYITGHNLGLAHSGKTEPDDDDDKSAYYEGMCNVNYLVL